MHILPKHYYLQRTLFDDKAVEIFLRKKTDFGGKKVKKGHAQTLLSSDYIINLLFFPSHPSFVHL